MNAAENSLTNSALDLYSNFQEVLEYNCGYSEEKALKVFAFDLYTSSPTVFLKNDTAAGEIDPRVIDLVHQCSMSELRAIGKVDRENEAATISEKLMAATTLVEAGNRRVQVEKVVGLVATASTSLVAAINNGNVTADLIDQLESTFEYDPDEVGDVLENLVTNSNSSSLCRFIENGTISSRDELDDLLVERESYSTVSKLRR